MTGFLDTLAQKLADRWLTLLALPGAVFLAGVWVARELGHASALSVPVLTEAAERTVAQISAWSAAGQALGAIAVVAAASGTGLVVRGLSRATTWLWLDEAATRPSLSWLTTWRANQLEARWDELIESRHQTQQPASSSTATAEPATELDSDPDAAGAKHRAAMRISLASPGRATWMGNRIHALQHTLKANYDLDLYWTWPHLWTVLPAEVHEDITAAHTAFRASAIRATWAIPWLIVSAWWWPALPVAAALAISGWHSGRKAITTLAQLAEAATDAYGPALAVQLGVMTKHERLTPEIGATITQIASKDR